MYVVLYMHSTFLTSLELTVNVTYKWVFIYVLKELTDLYTGVIECAQGTDGLYGWHGRLCRLRLL